MASTQIGRTTGAPKPGKDKQPSSSWQIHLDQRTQARAGPHEIPVGFGLPIARNATKILKMESSNSLTSTDVDSQRHVNHFLLMAMKGW